MIEVTRKRIPEDHPIRALFHSLTERGFEQLKLHDEETIEYISNMLTDFVDVKNMSRIQDDSGRKLDNTASIREVRLPNSRSLGRRSCSLTDQAHDGSNSASQSGNECDRFHVNISVQV